MKNNKMILGLVLIVGIYATIFSYCQGYEKTMADAINVHLYTWIEEPQPQFKRGEEYGFQYHWVKNTTLFEISYVEDEMKCAPTGIGGKEINQLWSLAPLNPTSFICGGLP